MRLTLLLLAAVTFPVLAELNGRIALLAAQRGRRPEKMKQDMAKDGSLANLYIQMREQKAVDKILEAAEVEDVDVLAEKQKEETEKKSKKSKKSESKSEAKSQVQSEKQDEEQSEEKPQSEQSE